MAVNTKVSLKAITPKRLRLIDENKLRVTLAYNMRSYLEYVRVQMQANYNSVAPSPTYTRTHALQQGWEIVEPVTAEQGTLVNNVRYSGFVQGPNRIRESGDLGNDIMRVQQSAAMRKRGWKSISDVARESKKRFKTVMNRSITGSVED